MWHSYIKTLIGQFSEEGSQDRGRKIMVMLVMIPTVRQRKAADRGVGVAVNRPLKGLGWRVVVGRLAPGKDLEVGAVVNQMAPPRKDLGSYKKLFQISMHLQNDNLLCKMIGDVS